MPDNVSVRAAPAAGAVRRRDRVDRRRAGQQRLDRSEPRSLPNDPTYHLLYQYGNPANPRAHYETTAPRSSRPAGGGRLRGGPRDGRDADGRRAAAERAQPERPDRRRRAAPRGRCRGCAASTTASSRRSWTWTCWTARSWSARTTRCRRTRELTAARASSPGSRAARRSTWRVESPARWSVVPSSCCWPTGAGSISRRACGSVRAEEAAEGIRGRDMW